MRWMRSTLLLLTVSVLTLAAGFVAGTRMKSVPLLEDGSATAVDTALVDQLQLSADQRDQMRAIWQRVQADVQSTYESAQQLQKRRDQDLIEILTDDQKAVFERISNDHATRFAELTRQREKAFQNAVEQTKQLLNESQRTKYQQILSSRLRGARPGDGGPGLSS